MLALDSVLAAALLTSTVCPTDSARLQALYPTVRGPLQALAVRWEILDPRELKYVLARPEDFASDLSLLRHRYRLYADAPPVADCCRFPDRAVVNDLLSFNRAYRQYIDVRQPVELLHGGELRNALQETDRLYQIWDAVRDARCEYYYVTVRRNALKQLRELIGEESYYNAALPPCVPLWRFQRID
jgi:hypothetical protein